MMFHSAISSTTPQDSPSTQSGATLLIVSSLRDDGVRFRNNMRPANPLRRENMNSLWNLPTRLSATRSKIVAVSGSWQAPSKTRTLTDALVEAINKQRPSDTTKIDLAEIGAEIAALKNIKAGSPEIQCSSLQSSSPTYWSWAPRSSKRHTPGSSNISSTCLILWLSLQTGCFDRNGRQPSSCARSGASSPASIWILPRSDPADCRLCRRRRL